MVILVDTNILMDVIADRKPYAEYGKEILEMCAKKTSHRNYGGTQYPKFILYTQKRFHPGRKAGIIKKFMQDITHF